MNFSRHLATLIAVAATTVAAPPTKTPAPPSAKASAPATPAKTPPPAHPATVTAKVRHTKPVPAKAPPPPWKSFYLNPAVRVKLDFRNASVDAVIQMLSQASGVTIIKDPGLKGGITLQSPRQQSLGDAFAMLDAVLNLKNYGLVKQDKFLLIKARPPGAPGGLPGAPHVAGHPVPGPTGPAAGAQPILRVYVLQYANATEVARVINEVFASGAPSPPPGFPPGVFPGRPGGAPSGATGPSVKASAEDYSNSLIVNAPNQQQDEIAEIIKQIDKTADQPEHPRVFHLQYAMAEDVAPVIENILTGSTPLGRGGSTTAQNDQNRNRTIYFFGGNQSSQNQNGTVVADTRTNSLVVTTTAENLGEIAQVIEQLDKPAVYQSTTFVHVLKNARADVVANLLNQSFGNRAANGPIGGSLTNSGVMQNTANQGGANNNNGGSNNQPPGLRSNSYSRQNGGNRQTNSGGSNLPNLSSETTGLDSAGHVVNIRNLMGAVLLVPNIDTNSVIVVAPPEDRELVEQILTQMDQIPEQVMIETLVVEANLDKTDQLGIEFNVLQKNAFGGVHGDTTATQSFGVEANTAQPQGLRYTLTAAQYHVFLQAVQSDTRFNVLSTPRIFTTNNATAQINISQSLPYVTNQTVETTGTVLYNYNFLDVGIVLTVTPRITSNGYVTMDVSQTANDFVGYTSFNAPIVNQREAQTTVSVKDGETVVLGGIINDSVNKTVSKVPFLGDLPLLGNLFRSTSKTDKKTELLVFLTPRVVHDPQEARTLREQTESELGKTTQQMLPAAQKPLGGTARK